MCETKKNTMKNMTKIRRTLKARISVMDGQIHFKFGMGGALPQGSFHTKFLSSHYQATDVRKLCFLSSCKTHTCLLHGCTWPHNTLSCVLITYNYVQRTCKAMLLSTDNLLSSGYVCVYISKILQECIKCS